MIVVNGEKDQNKSFMILILILNFGNIIIKILINHLFNHKVIILIKKNKIIKIYCQVFLNLIKNKLMLITYLISQWEK